MERPILFSGPMVRAILDGHKTQTRRVMKPQPIEGMTYHRVVGHRVGLSPDDRQSPYIWCPYGLPGDRLWVRETFFYEWPEDYPPDDMRDCRIIYRADEPDYITDEMREFSSQYRWSPSIHMPRWASRLTLEITDVRVERVRWISEHDAMEEGVTIPEHKRGTVRLPGGGAPVLRTTYGSEFAELWNSINAKHGYGWSVNPWVWVIEFRKLDRDK
jgi:hypothetical protein